MSEPASARPILTIEAKTGISKAILPEPFLVSLYRSLAPYRGCAHGCRYCDGRAEKYYVEGDFERDIAARTNLPDLVARDVESGIAAREWGSLCIGSGVTDVYQPVERELCLTRKTLEALIPTKLPIVILTKSDLVLRDFDLLARFPRALVIVTVTTTDPEIAAALEPGASPPERRLEVVRQARAAGFLSGVLAMPLCPGITDTEENTGKLFRSTTEAGAQFTYPGGLTLRPGRQKDLFVSLVDRRFPALRPLYDEVYRENRQSGMPLFAYETPVVKAWDGALSRERIPQIIPHSVYREILSPPDSLFILLCHMETLYAMRGVDTRPLKDATKKYAEWLSKERTALRRTRLPVVESDPFPLTRVLTERFSALASGDGFAELTGNAKLATLVREVSVEKKVFDYSTLSARVPG
jgi:DNA repair photolyase